MVASGCDGFRRAELGRFAVHCGHRALHRMKGNSFALIAFCMHAALAGCAVSPDPAPTKDAGIAVGAGSATVCCHEFPEVLSRRVHPVLEQIPGVTGLQRLRTTDGSLCYRFGYEGPLEPLEARLRSELHTSSSLSFKVERYGSKRAMDLVFDGGFD